MNTVREQPRNPSAPAQERFKALENELWAHYGLSPRERYLSLPGLSGKLRAFEVGEGKPLLFIHGGGSLASWFVPLLPHLSGYRLILFDRPGHGLSDGFDYRGVDLRAHANEVVRGVLDALELERVPIVANSHGGLWAFWLALDQPERVESVVQLGCPGHLLETAFQTFWARLFMQPAVQRIVLGLEAKRLARASTVNPMAWTRLGQRPDALKRLPEAFFRLVDALVFLPSFRSTVSSLGGRLYTLRGPGEGVQLTEADLADIRTPTFFFWGDHDPTGGPDVGRRAVELMPDASIEVISGGHMPWLDEPEGCARSLCSFVERGAGWRIVDRG